MGRTKGGKNANRQPEIIGFEFMVRRLLLVDPSRPTSEIVELTGRDPSEVRKMIADVRRRYELPKPSRKTTDRVAYYESRISADINRIATLLHPHDPADGS